MARLFVTPRELNFISDITKEYIKDIIGQFIYYYPISEIKTLNHDIYNESIEKVFDNPIKIEAHIGQPVQADTTGKIGYEQNWTLEVFIQHRDMLDKSINISVGDFFTYGSVTYEIVAAAFVRNIFGQVEHIDGIKLTGQNVRESQFKVPKIGGPTSQDYNDPDAVQDEFVQQRGFENNRQGPTADKRDLQKSGVLTEPLTGPAEVSGEGDPEDVGSAFYDES
jgi:hypothetical protein